MTTTLCCTLYIGICECDNYIVNIAKKSKESCVMHILGHGDNFTEVSYLFYFLNVQQTQRPTMPGLDKHTIIKHSMPSMKVDVPGRMRLSQNKSVVCVLQVEYHMSIIFHRYL